MRDALEKSPDCLNTCAKGIFDTTETAEAAEHDNSHVDHLTNNTP